MAFAARRSFGGGAPTSERGLGSAVSDLGSGLARLTSETLTLARLELARDMRVLATDVAGVAAFCALLGIGYGLVAFAAALGLASRMGAPLAFLAVGAVHVLAGALGTIILLRRARDRRGEMLAETRAEARETARELRHLRESIREGAPPGLPSRPVVAPSADDGAEAALEAAREEGAAVRSGQETRS